MLLLFDNCEHVIDDAAAVTASLLGAGPGIDDPRNQPRASRAHRGVAVPRAVPLAETKPPSSSSSEPERAGCHRTRSDQLDAITTICDRLDHMPLALELAAARTRSLSLDEIVDRVDDRFALLTGGDRTAAVRHQTLRGVVDWSYELLFSAEQRVLSICVDLRRRIRSARCRSRCVRVTRLRCQTSSTSSEISSTSRWSPSHDRNGQTRYTMLQTLADYGRHQLHAAGEDADARDRHLRWMVELATSAESGLRTSAQLTMGRADTIRTRQHSRRAGMGGRAGPRRRCRRHRRRVRLRLVHQRSDQRRARFDHAGALRRRRGSLPTGWRPLMPGPGG